MRNLIITLSLLLFIAVSCSSDDDSACTPVECLNGGIETVDCGCDCPEGYSGTDCSTQITPSSITILRVNVKKFPDRKPNGDRWDTGLFGIGDSDADIFFTIENDDFEEIYQSSTYYEDASGLGTEYPFTLEPPLTINSVNSIYVLWLKDYDGSSSDYDLMSYVIFQPYNASLDGFPSTRTITNTIDTFEIDLTVEYTF